MALTSAGDLLLNLAQLSDIEGDVHRLVGLARHRQVFIGIVVPKHRLPNVLAQIDNAAAEIAGITEAPFIREHDASAGSASGRSSVPPASTRQGRPERRAQHPRGRRRGP